MTEEMMIEEEMTEEEMAIEEGTTNLLPEVPLGHRQGL